MAEQKVSNHRLLVSSTDSADDPPPSVEVLVVTGCPGVLTTSAVDERAGTAGVMVGSGSVATGTDAWDWLVLAEPAGASAGELVDGLGSVLVGAADDADDADGGLFGAEAEPGPQADSRQAVAPTRTVPVHRRTVIPFQLG